MGKTYPRIFFSHQPPAVEPQTCFVIMPFSESLRDVYSSIHAAVTGREVNFSSCIRADEIVGGGHIMDSVLDQIARAEVIVADVTDRRPNVFYEIGVAHAVKPFETVIIITQSMEDMPFDIKDFRIIQYTCSAVGLEDLKQQLVAYIRGVTPASLRFAVIHSEIFVFQHRLARPDGSLYYFAVGPLHTALHTAIGFAKFHMIVHRYVDGKSDEIVSEDDYGLKGGGYVDIPVVKWRLNLDRVAEGRAHFCLCEPESNEVQQASS